MTKGYQGDVDKAIENYAQRYEATADGYERSAEALESGGGSTYTPADRMSAATQYREMAEQARGVAQQNRTGAGREHLRTTGTFIA